VTRELHPRDAEGMYVQTTMVAKADFPKRAREAYDRFMELIVHKTQLEHDTPSREIVRVLRKYVLYLLTVFDCPY
jgi:hypothetical protein